MKPWKKSEDLEVIKKNNLGNDNKNLKKVINEKLKNLKEHYKCKERN